MNIKSNNSYLLPLLQEALLRASLLQSEEAIGAWNYWKSNADPDKIDQGSYRLLPLLYKNLSLLKVKDPLLDKFKDIYRLTWRNNQMLFHKMAAVLSSFHNAEIQTMLLKGSALTLLHYKDYGLRPMSDFDVLVPAKQILEAKNLLSNLGWKPRSRIGERFTENSFSVRHAYGFEDISGLEIDLHKHILMEFSSAEDYDIFWKKAVPIKVHDVSTCALDPTDQLLHVCIHGAWWNCVPPFRWVADAMMVINNPESEIDWEHLTTEAQKCHVVLPLRNALNYLHEKFYAPVPHEVLRYMNEVQVSKTERSEYKYITKPLSLFSGFMKLWIQHSRLNQNRGLIYKLFKFPTFLQYTWGADNIRQIPRYIISKGFLMLSGKINSYKYN